MFSHISNQRIKKIPIWAIILLLLTCISFLIILGLLLFPPNGRPNIDKLPFTLDWEISQVDGRIQAIVPDGSMVLIVTNNALEKYDNQQNLLWQMKNPDYWKIINKPILGEDTMFIDDTESVIAINKTNGHNIWSTKHPNEIIARAKFLGISNGRVFVELYDHGLYALDTTTGEIVWNLHYSREYAGIHFYEDKIVILLTKQILILDVKNGNVINKVEIGFSNFSASEGEKIFYGVEINSGNYELRTYDVNTGVIEVIYRTGEEIHCVSLTKGIIYINSGLRIIKLSTSGEVFWDIDYPRYFIHSIYPSEGKLFVLDEGGRFFGLNSIDGRFIGEIRNYRLTNPKMYTIYNDNNNSVELLLCYQP